MKAALASSVAAHLLAVAALVVLSARIDRPPPPPDDRAVIEVMEGAGPAGAPAAQPGPEETAPPPTPPTPAPAPAEAEAAASPDDQPPPPPDATDAPPPPPVALARADAAAAPPAPDAPPPQPRAAAPAIRLGGGDDTPVGRIAGDDPSVLPAKADTGNRAPSYPLEAARRREQGMVLVRIHIDATGAVSRVDVVRSSGSPRLDRAAHDQIATTWHFRPAIKDGQTVPDVLDLNINFVMD